ncbi:MAG: helix-turn-helix domain-containing protein, partial [Thermoanaerobaculia bacterium]
MTLTAKQMIAIEELFRGTTVTEAAEVIGVSRKTVSNWKNNVTEFRAELNRFRAEHQERVGDRLVSLLDLALDVIHARLEE